MKIHNLINRYTLFSSLLFLGAISSTPATAAPLVLSDIPLFLTQSAESNIFFLFDDSGSMRNEVISQDIPNNTDGANFGSLIVDGTNDYKYVFYRGQQSGATAGTYVDIETYTGFLARSRNEVAPTTLGKARAPEYNKLYYDPSRTYEPWPGKSAYAATAAPIDPNNPGGTRVDLTQSWPAPQGGGTTYNPMVYYTWDSSTNTTTGPTTVPSSQYQNFSNWFTYHRSREYEAKYALAKTINDVPLGTRLRMGYDTLSNQYKQRMTSVTSLVAGDTGDTNRTTLLDSVYSIQAESTTPLRQAYQRSADYFACDGNRNPWDTNASTCALQKTPPVAGEVPAAACQQNFMVVLTDGVDQSSFTAETGRNNADNDADSYFDQGAYDSATGLYDPGPYASTNTNWMADLAMYYYETDLDTTATIPNKVPTSCGVDENPQQHLVTYAMSFGVSPSITAPATQPQLNIAPSYCPATTVSALSGGWQDSISPSDSVPVQIQKKTNDLLHAAYNGRGKYYNADQPDQLLQGLRDVINDVSARRGSAASAGFSGTTNETGTLAFFSSFNSGGWFGDLVADLFDSSGNLSQVWSAASILNGLTNTVVKAGGGGRTIVTYASSAGKPFTWSNISSAQQTDLKTDTDGTANSDAIGQERLDYIRGDHSCETGHSGYDTCAYSKGFRPRKDGSNNETRLGDMIHSSPVYVGESIGNYPDTAPFPTSTNSYQNFQSSTSTRTPMVYVGSNDGMLHGFRATYDTSVTPNYDGKEIFAYVPAALSPSTASTTSGLHKLTESTGHHSYVDLTPTVADAYTTIPSDSTRKWRTILVGGLRSGGKGVYAIDVTDPVTDMTTEANAANKVMWEFTSADDPDLGYTYSEPVIIPLRIGSGSAISDIQWFAVFGNGYNSTNGHAVLFLLKLSGPTGGAASSRTWTLNTDYYKIDTGVGTSTTPNGLSSPAVIDNNGDGIYDRVYAGDLEGNMWAFNLGTASPSTWASAYDTSGTPKPLFTASSATGTTQPITTKPLVVRNKQGGVSDFPNVLVLFGTGSYIADGDATNTDGQTYYAVWDHGSQELTRSDLLGKSLLNSSTDNYRVIDPTVGVPDYSASPPDNGWYLDLPDSGERVNSKSFLVGSNVFFSTIVPSASPCSGGGSSWLMAVDPTTGNSPGIPTFDYTGNGVIDSSDIPTLASDNDTQLAGMKLTSMVPQYSFLVNEAATSGNGTNPCSQGTAVIGMGTSSEATVVSQSLCTGGSSAKAGRYSWRQLDFN